MSKGFPDVCGAWKDCDSALWNMYHESGPILYSSLLKNIVFSSTLPKHFQISSVFKVEANHVTQMLDVAAPQSLKEGHRFNFNSTSLAAFIIDWSYLTPKYFQDKKTMQRYVEVVRIGMASSFQDGTESDGRLPVGWRLLQCMLTSCQGFRKDLAFGCTAPASQGGLRNYLMAILEPWQVPRISKLDCERVLARL